MKKNYKERIERDENGNIILEEHEDGFCEESYYYNGKLIRQVTRYSNGIVETDHYALPKEDQ